MGAREGQLAFRRYLLEELQTLRDDLIMFLGEAGKVRRELERLAKELDEDFSRISKAKVAGSSTAIVGGVIAGIGFVTSFFTFGATLPLLIGGSAVGLAGGATAGGAAVADAILSKKSKNKASQHANEYNKTIESLHRKGVDLGINLQRIGDIDNSFPEWCRFWLKLLCGTEGAKKGIDVDNVGNLGKAAVNGLRLASYLDDVAGAGIKGGVPLVRALGCNVARGIHVVGGVAGILLMPIDIYTLVDSAIDIHKNNPHEVAQMIRKLAKDLQEQCPTVAEVNHMINETRAKLTANN